ncbi:hypothetical protein GXW83_21285 [Streptacidiphilus sp. PB12-B1b]|uniref:hypothetical protein n=1 Tax=Streptacidiphilus sp. PB12-B1b TaxID=2705012 RepID=UPI0015FAF4F3|nr:hypothetical protein [Streptacidiphilus sp. PB12-B1b]QMU77846.1 hypothetical protein GXW83_21285 [Streptacidiphilus sp. PB12-B1b]
MTGESAERVAAVLRTLRPYLGWICCAAGAVLCGLGWYGVSGERYTARQIPYLASATAPGAALLAGGLVLLAARGPAGPDGPEQQRSRRQIDTLYALLTETETQGAATEAGPDAAAAAAPEAGPEPEPGPASGGLLAVAGGSSYHRPGCVLLEGRSDPEPVTPASAAGRGLRPCPLCEPPEA